MKYAPDVLEARGSSSGRVVLIEKRETTGAPGKLALSTDRQKIAADGEDLSIITVEVRDAQGRLMPIAGNEVGFKITGPGSLIGLGNGDPSCHESDKPLSSSEGSRSAFNGLCMAFVQALKQPGEIRITAAAAGLAPASTIILAQPAKPRPVA